MENISNIEYGNACSLQYKLSIDCDNPDTGTPLTASDLHVTLYIKSDLDEDATVTVTGVYDSTDDVFNFNISQTESELLTVGTWYYGFEVRISDINGKVIHRNTYSRKIVKTGAKS